MDHREGHGLPPLNWSCISKMDASHNPASAVIGGTGWVPLWLSFHIFCRPGRNSNICSWACSPRCCGDGSPGTAVYLDGLPVGRRLSWGGASGNDVHSRKVWNVVITGHTCGIEHICPCKLGSQSEGMAGRWYQVCSCW